VNYGSSSVEELYHQEGSKDFDWDQGFDESKKNLPTQLL
tara:strand:- start:343 stop:459 length:117 start_codon:yes stop_codon:yes gene_type:complete